MALVILETPAAPPPLESPRGVPDFAGEDGVHNQDRRVIEPPAAAGLPRTHDDATDRQPT